MLDTRQGAASWADDKKFVRVVRVLQMLVRVVTDERKTLPIAADDDHDALLLRTSEGRTSCTAVQQDER
jgi:hypothetical protein